ncbi:GHMP kinase [Candidatus Woesearchaeota archaeon]|nr:GHMP kinase [Candidatus Woesearchaeota archaeon]
MISKAFAPANISCVFRICRHKNPRWAGSCGFGFTLNEGVIATAAKAERNRILFNKHPINFPTVASLIEKLTKEKLTVDIKSRLHLGCGFGLSGASALATAYAINKLLNLKKSNKELAIIAHTAEVENKTGLGDVVNQYYGGFCVKLKPSSHFVIERLNIKDADVYCRCFSQLPTKSIIANPSLESKINKSASRQLNKIKELMKKNKRINFKKVIELSKGFAVKSGLLNNKRAIDAIKKIEKSRGNASMIMLGNAVFSDKPFKNAAKFKISGKGACLL